MLKNNSENRVLALEGVRGVAAVMVVMFHALISLFPVIHYGIAGSSVPHTRFDDNVHGSFLYMFVNGIFAVSVFFVLSGFVLSIGFFNSRNSEEAESRNLNQALKRYLRLMIPALASVLIAWLILKLGLNYNQQAFELSGSPRLGAFWTFEPNLFSAIYQGLIGIFKGQYWYNEPLWTMQWEFLGSFFVFGLIGIFGRSKARYLVYSVGFIILLHSYLLGFLIGVIIADIYANRQLKQLKFWQGMTLGMIGMSFAIVNPTAEDGISKFLLGINSWPFTWYFLGATLIIYAVIATAKINNVMSTKWMVSLGKNTFSIYLLHDLIILTIMSFVFFKLQPQVGYKPAAILSLISFIVVLVPATYLFTKYVDAFAIKTSRNFAIVASTRSFGIKLKITKVKSFLLNRIKYN